MCSGASNNSCLKHDLIYGSCSTAIFPYIQTLKTLLIMKKLSILFVLGSAALILSNCGPSKKATASVPKLTYEGNLQAVIVANCSPCHIPSKGGNKRPYDNYANVKSD